VFVAVERTLPGHFADCASPGGEDEDVVVLNFLAIGSGEFDGLCIGVERCGGTEQELEFIIGVVFESWLNFLEDLQKVS
jgi:hypothetical protein